MLGVLVVMFPFHSLSVLAGRERRALVCLGLCLVLASASFASRFVPCRTGNLSVGYLMAFVRGEEPPGEAMLGELDEYVKLGFTGVEDYISWVALERAPGEQDWRYYDRNEKAVHDAGLRYGVFPWIHFAPPWVWDEGRFEPAVCVEHGQPTSSPSIWAPSTLRTYDEFYRMLRAHFVGKVDYIGVAMPADYGQVGYPAALANWVVPVHHVHAGYWCGDPYARADFAASMMAKYRRLEVINSKWGTYFAQREDIAFPLDQENAVWWLDFARWYYDSMTDFTGKLVSVARSHFPSTPLTVKVGHASEKVPFGSDYSAIPRMAAKYDFSVSFQTAESYLAAKRVSSACRFYGARCIGDAPGPMDEDVAVRRLFTEISCGSDEYLDFPYNFLNTPELYEEYLPLLTGEDALCSVALFFPTSHQRLAGSSQAYLSVLLQASEVVRDLTDYDVLDERMIGDDALVGREVLIWADGNVVDQETFRRILAWVKQGGTVITWGRGPIIDANGDALPEPGRAPGEYHYRGGKWIVVEGELDENGTVFERMARRVHQLAREERRSLLEVLPDRERDGVLATCFPNRIVLYNGTAGLVEKTVWPSPGSLGLPSVRVKLEPRSISVLEISR